MMRYKKYITAILCVAFLVAQLIGCGSNTETDTAGTTTAIDTDSLQQAASMTATDADSLQQAGTTTADEATQSDSSTEIPLLYATEFTIESYEGMHLITIGGEDKYLVVPENENVPDNLDKDITVLKQPLDNTYLVSSSAMDLVCAIDAEDKIKLTGTKAEDWYVDKAKAAMEDGSMLYAGKYNTPDYELLLANGCGLAIENTMIYHNPETKEKLEELGIPVLVERSSYEADPRGRLEWIKLYGVLFGREQESVEYYNELIAPLDSMITEEATGETVAYFYITGSGTINVRKPKDYISRLIEIAGGSYVFEKLEGEDENALSTINMQVEEFYASAKDADVLIYNSTIAGEPESLAALLKLCPILADFKAVKEGRVYSTGNNFFQRTCSMSEFAVEVGAILRGTAEDEMEFLHRLE